jgi:hypothetical protein
MFYWKVWLNMEPSNFPKHMIQPIGKNAWYHGPNENVWKTESITVIGYAKIYNEESLWKLIGKNRSEMKSNSMEIIAELYKIHGFETTLDYLDGDFGFILLDYNIFGEQARLFVAKDPFGICPLYKIEYNDSYYKKVHFVTTEKNNIYEFTEHLSIPETGSSPLYIEIPSPNPGSGISPKKIKYVFSNESMGFCDAFVESIPNGTFCTFIHSYKVSANWKKDSVYRTFYELPFQSTYSNQKRIAAIQEDRMEEQIKEAFEKRIEWIHFCHMPKNMPKMGVLRMDKDIPEEKQTPSSGMFINPNFENSICEIDIRLFPESNQKNKDGENKNGAEKDSVEMIYLEMKYPTLLQEIKTKINSNDPGIIRAHYIPAIIAKHIVEKYPGLKVIFMAESFTYEYLEMDMFERRKFLKNMYFLEKVRGWTETFLLYGLELYMPFLDRILIQTPDQYIQI